MKRLLLVAQVSVSNNLEVFLIVCCPFATEVGLRMNMVGFSQENKLQNLVKMKSYSFYFCSEILCNFLFN